MKQTLMYAALVLAYALAATGCNKSEETAAPGANTAEQTAPATQAVQQKEIRMVAKINGTEITSADV
ncbi:MAG: hypothetical protein GY868_10965, partial [Deltaproteobacteria bacterium]|nr:hypothetical protein [Deltaproteobacteria bacterium]